MKFRRQAEPVDFATHKPRLRNEIILTLIAAILLGLDLAGLAYL